MKTILTVILVISVFASAIYLSFINNTKQLNSDPDSDSAIESSESEKISNLSFSYRTSPDGYVLINDQINWPENIISSISLIKKLDYERSSQPEFVGEGPPSIVISVFKNPDLLNAKAWAEANELPSNIELIDSAPIPTEVGGVEGIYYLVLGLYLFDTYVFAHRDEIYLLSGGYYEKNDEYQRNFSEVMATVVFEK
ncbi:hypothetical protein KC723_00650 [Candidatus Kaiserbacteria bacterium]|nr:hypothetical protein [Candidatus Kaiserbacteria bacterium]